MAVHTKLEKAQIETHLQNYQLGKLINFKEIVDGIDNSNFVLETDLGRFILTFFYKFKIAFGAKKYLLPAPNC